jgi:mono/diheme cytochrome c family protein
MSLRPRIPPAAAGVVAIAAAYIYFLLYAQFGFVSYLKLFHPDPLPTEKSMGAMGLGGLVFSVLTAVLLRRVNPSRLLVMAFAGCSVSALLTLTGTRAELLYAAAFLIGASTGTTTVTLAAGVRSWLSGPRFGWHVGLGTGLAYLFCNIPWVFDASPVTQTVLSALVCLLGAVAVWSSPGDGANTGGIDLRPGHEFAPAGFAVVVAMFFALIWLDSTAFATIQLTEGLRAHTWGTPPMKMGLGIVHFAAAVAAGWMIDRRWLKGLLVATFLLFVAAFTLLQSGTSAAWFSGPLYAVGISVYSTALVAFPSLHAERVGLVAVRWRAALLYAVAGWVGSGLGVGLAQHLHSIPPWLMVAAGIPIVAGCIPAVMRNNMATPYAALLFAGIGGILYFSALAPEAREQVSEPSVELGRAVYRQEGCINCHSQYIRPNDPRDILWWGPYRDIDRTERPPMVGNRRQGPDLLNAGLRRTPEWHRQHLVDPASLSPGSRMPSYAHLFRVGDPRGASLVLYLASLGRASLTERWATIQSWAPDTAGHVPSEVHGRSVFERNCMMCHGAEGKGDGDLSGLFFRPAMNLANGPFLYVPSTLPDAEQQVALSRIVKFGLVGFHMPGHETMDDRDVVDVVAYVRTLAAKDAR